jgi:hypothetical protein
MHGAMTIIGMVGNHGWSITPCNWNDSEMAEFWVLINQLLSEAIVANIIQALL